MNTTESPQQSLESLMEGVVPAAKRLGRKLKSVTLQDTIDSVFKEIHTEIEDHVRKANLLGREWTKRKTIKWFANLTVGELLKDYRR